jgi:hypothetical protein
MEDVKNENIYDVKNYEKKIYLKHTSNYITKYVDLINEFVIHGSVNIKIQDKNLYLFVFNRGLDSLKHIFLFLLMYTKNLDLTYHHCNKAYLYYIEFISQIGEDNNSFLQLSSRDAAMFIYKKTIFDINNNLKKNFTLTKSEKSSIEIVKQISNLYNNLIKLSLECLDSLEIHTNKNKIIFIEKETTKIINRILLENVLYDVNICNNLIDFIYIIELKNIIYKKKMDIIYLFLKKNIQNKKTDIKTINAKCCGKDFDKKIQLLTPLKLINWLFN